MKVNSLEKYSRTWEKAIPKPKIRLINPCMEFQYTPLRLLMMSELLYGKKSRSNLEGFASNLFKELKTTNIQSTSEIRYEIKKQIRLGLFGEFYMKIYLMERGVRYGIKINKDLDKFFYTKRGDFEGIYKGKKVIIEVEKRDKDFISHKKKKYGLHPLKWTSS